MFSLSGEALCPETLRAQLEDAGAGGYAAFEGWVRDRNEGRAVERLEYEAYAPMAQREGARIVQEALARFGAARAACVHRVGRLEIGELAVWVGVSAEHRGEAFAACRYIIDEVKHRVPIWKKEHYADGASGWVRCEACAAGHDHAQGSAIEPMGPRGPMGHIGPIGPIGPMRSAATAQADAAAYYARQTILPEIGAAGQARLGAARVLVVGAGGLGCAALPYLAGAGVGSIAVCESDTLDASNLHRQTLYAWHEVGQAKAALAQARLEALNPLVQVHALPERLGPENAARIVGDCDLVLDCTDNFETKFLLNDACVRAGRTLVQASIYQYEGQLFVYRPGGPCLRCVWPEVPAAGCVGSCAEAGILGAVAGVFGALQAAEALKQLLGLPGALHDRTLFFDLLHYTRRLVRAQRQADCPVCGAGAGAAAQAALLLELDPIAIGLEALAAFEIVDLRDAAEAAQAPLAVPGCTVRPAPGEAAHCLRLEPGRRYLLCCARGVRSRVMAMRLRDAGHAEVYSVAGGARRLLAFAAHPAAHADLASGA